MGHFKYISSALCVAFSVICPHGFSILLAFDVQTLPRSNLDNQLKRVLGFSISVLQSKLIICKLQKEFSCNFAAQDGILVSGFEGMTCCLDFCVNFLFPFSSSTWTTLTSAFLDPVIFPLTGSPREVPSTPIVKTPSIFLKFKSPTVKVRSCFLAPLLI